MLSTPAKDASRAGRDHASATYQEDGPGGLDGKGPSAGVQHEGEGSDPVLPHHPLEAGLSARGQHQRFRLLAL